VQLAESNKIKGYDVSAKNVDNVNMIFRKTGRVVLGGFMS
jgi:hypothetical protein